jgi:hypothetical protein
MVKEEALQRTRILVFWEKYGLQATLDAFCIKKRTLYRWKNLFQHSGRNATLGRSWMAQVLE